MPTAHSLDSVTPGLSLQPLNFAREDPGVGGWRGLLEQAVWLESAGIDRLVVSDHVVFGENLEAYADPKAGGIKGGRQPTGPDGHWLDPLVVLAMWASRTQRIRLMTGILIAPLRRPASLAKSTATLDVLSEGRLDLGVGVGWQREEYEANGLPFRGRGVLLDETLEVCQRLWNDAPATYRSDAIAFEKIHLNPKPLQAGGVPLWISGTLNPNVLRRIVRFGSGWVPWGDDIRDPVAGLARIREALEAAGRDASRFQATTQLPLVRDTNQKLDLERTMEGARQLVEGGITDLRIQIALPEERAAVEDTLTPIVQAFRSAVGRA